MNRLLLKFGAAFLNKTRQLFKGRVPPGAGVLDDVTTTLQSISLILHMHVFKEALLPA